MGAGFLQHWSLVCLQFLLYMFLLCVCVENAKEMILVFIKIGICLQLWHLIYIRNAGVLEQKIEKQTSMRWIDTYGSHVLFSAFRIFFFCYFLFSVSLGLLVSLPLSAFLPPVFPHCPLCSASLSIRVHVCVCVYVWVSSSLMFWACQCNGASVVSRVCCLWIALRQPARLDSPLELTGMLSTCRICYFIKMCIYMKLDELIRFKGNAHCRWICMKFAQGVRVTLKNLACCYSSVGYL